MNDDNDGLIERIVEALNAETSPEWNSAPDWTDYVLTREGLRRLANDLLGRRPYDGRDPLASPVTWDFLAAALKAEGYVVLTAGQADMVRRGLAHYGPLCPKHKAHYGRRARKVGTVPDASFTGAVCAQCARCVDVDEPAHEVTIYVW